MKAVVVEHFGGPEMLQQIDTAEPGLAPGQVLVEVAVAGANFSDVYQRRGTTPVRTPFRAGVEGVGTVVALGSGVTDPVAGARVGWLSGGQGSFAEFVAVDATRTVPIPPDIDDQTAVACLMQGITAQYLTTDTYRVRAGETALLHAAAGGVGLLLTQLVKHAGGRVIATTSTSAKTETARSAGADVVVGYDDVVAAVRDDTAGLGVPVVYDAVGAATFESSLSCLRPRGTLVSYGAASGPPAPVDVALLNAGGSLYLTRPSVVHYTATTAELRRRAADVFARVAAGQLTVSVSHRLPMSRAADAFALLESRRTTGKVLLVP